jgi:eukaryotic-like serine/threonine-protein kinase
MLRTDVADSNSSRPEANHKPMSSHPHNSSQPVALKPGDKLGPYRIEREIGSGGMADVFYAMHEVLRRPAAVKVLRASLAADDVHLQRFMQEARAAASLIHPNIVQVYDVGQEGEHRYIAQEFIPGSNLRQYLSDHGQMPLQETLSVLLQILAALNKSASVGIVHRDIKPENIMLTEDGEVKVADYGLARVLLSDDPQLTRAGTTLGTPMYMSPEQIQEGDVNVRSDLYSLGVTLFHMLAGRPPFTGETPLALAMQHVQAAPPKISELRADLPPSLVGIVHRLLEKEPEERFASPAEVLEALRSHRFEDLAGYWPDHTIPLPGAANTLSLGPSAATLLLRSKLHQQHRKSRRRMFYLAATPVLATLSVLAGNIVAGFKQTDLLDNKEPTFGSVPRREKVKDQYADALLHADNSRNRWQAIPVYFPPSDSELNRLYSGKAWLQLAGVHLKMGDFQRARETLELISRDNRMPHLIHVLAALRRAEIDEADDRSRPGAAENALQNAQSMANEESTSKSDRELIDQFILQLPPRLQELWKQR